MMKKLNIKLLQYNYLKNIAIALFFFTVINIAYAKSTGGVLVAAKFSPVQKISILEIRRVYLSLPSSTGNTVKQPVINLSDIETYKVFLKNIMHMTESGYRRKMVKNIFRQGGEKLKEIQEHEKLIIYLIENPNRISFMDKDAAIKSKDIKIIQTLW